MHRAVLSLIEVPILASVKFINSKKKVSAAQSSQPFSYLPATVRKIQLLTFFSLHTNVHTKTKSQYLSS